MGALETSHLGRSSAGGFFDNGELILVTDNRNTTADLYQIISGTATGSSITLDGGNYNGIATISPREVTSPPLLATVAKARFVRYFIDNTTDPAHPTLMVQRLGGNAAQPLADDIEDMQFDVRDRYDTPTDGVVDSWIPGPTLAQLSQVRQVRLRFIARTRLPEAGWSETRPALGNHNPPERHRTGIAAGHTTS